MSFHYNDDHDFDARLKAEIKKALGIAFFGGAIAGMLFFLFSCAPAKSDEGAHAVEIPGPVGVYCYAVVENGKAVGGNCLWSR